mmetsp:Transcript_92008/g.257156  ORF Transcript_92008/g.257156 Transcript_92008/m.257156 type:complete len:280 (-) Transcript_92008:135-974(-)
MARRPRALAALAISWLPGAFAEEIGGCAWGSDCAADDEAALSLRQLRAAARLDDSEGAGADFDPALPGGWGEAADFVTQANEEEKALLNESSDDLGAGAMGRWGSCARYRCVPYFVRGHGCQCNHHCTRYGSCCNDYFVKCRAHHHHAPAPPPPPPPHHQTHNVMKLYHQTGSDVGPLILSTGFRPGTQGWCGGGIYFATSAQATKTKAIGPDSHKGYLLEATVDVGRVKYMPKACDRSLNGQSVLSEGFDSVSFDPGDGQEYIVYSNSRILSVRHIPL